MQTEQRMLEEDDKVEEYRGRKNERERESVREGQG